MKSEIVASGRTGNQAVMVVLYRSGTPLKRRYSMTVGVDHFDLGADKNRAYFQFVKAFALGE